MLTFGMGASTQALFARVGGGIFTKAADVGADLVGKVEAGIPEDDPRNPATIADNVGDNVGDVAGMGADLYESYGGSILATARPGRGRRLRPGRRACAPMVIAGVGVIFSVLGIFLVRSGEKASQKVLLKALARGINASTFLDPGRLVLHPGAVQGVVPWAARGHLPRGHHRPDRRLGDRQDHRVLHRRRTTSRRSTWPSSPRPARPR